MAPKIIDLDSWLRESAAGQYARAWEQDQFDALVADLFGFHALQIGTQCIHGLNESRIQHHWCAALPSQLECPAGAQVDYPCHILTAPEALPFDANQLDLILMPHTLESCHQPHAALREAARVLRPEGKLIISGFNPARFFGIRPKAKHMQWGSPIGYWRIRDWLQLLDLEISETRSGCYLPALRSAQWLNRLRWVDRLADQHLHFLGGIYFIVATKHIKGARLLEAEWRTPQVKLKKLPLASAPSRVQSRQPSQSPSRTQKQINKPPQHSNNDS